ncbi:unnamed protein product, partial [Polarella glacialis]
VSGPSLSSQKELQELRDRLRQEEQQAGFLRQQVQSTPRVLPSTLPSDARAGELWRYNSPDGLPLHIRQAPDLEAPRTNGMLQPGDLFLVAELARAPGGITFLRLADGRGWVFDRKPAPKVPPVSRRVSLFGDESQAKQAQDLILCSRVAGSEERHVVNAIPAFQSQAIVGLSRPSILDSRLPPAEARKAVKVVQSSPSTFPPRTTGGRPGSGGCGGHLEAMTQAPPMSTSEFSGAVGSHEESAIERYRELYLQGQLEGFEILDPDSVFHPHLVKRSLPDVPPSSVPATLRKTERQNVAAPSSESLRRTLPPRSSLGGPEVPASSSTSGYIGSDRGSVIHRWPAPLHVRVLAARDLQNTDGGGARPTSAVMIQGMRLLGV